MTEVIKILLIEDDEDDYFLTSDYLERCDSPKFLLTWATDSDSAIEALKQDTFDLCLLDFLLGAENALDVIDKLKANQYNLPVVILTGQSDSTVDEMVMRAGAADYLQKSEIESPRFMRTIRYALVRRDIENERMERNKVEQKNKAKDKFLAHLGHELRTPLTSILGYTELLIDDARNSPFQQELSIIHSNGKHLLSLLNDLLDMSRIMADKLELNMKEVNLAAFLTDIHSLMQLNAKDKGLSLNVVPKTKLPEFIRTDPTRLRQILINLITNAVKFTDKGSITLTIEMEPSKVSQQSESYAESKALESVLRFTVDDTGIGMAPDKLDNIFHPFEQIEDVMRANHGGAGLGLAICKELVCKLEGDISVSSKMGEGSSFSFFINPGNLSDQTFDELSLGQVAPVEPSNLNMQLTGKVLIVDDLREIRRLTGHLVSQSKADISYAENGVKALEAVLQADEQNAPFNLVLMDIHMPVMNGIEALHAIRRHGKDLPVIAVTAASRKGLKESLIREGFNDVIGKPIDRFALASLLTLYLPEDNPVTFSNVETQVSGMPINKPFAPERPETRVKLDVPSPLKPQQEKLPTSEVKSAEHEEKQTQPSAKRVLVVEDDEDAAELLQLFLTHLGCEVVKSLCGSDALDAVDEQSFDHILMDLTLPDYDGYELAKKIKLQQTSCKLTIVSGHQADESTMRSIGIDSALLKPVTKNDLESILV
ncbi:MAG: hybrid sensor histidine kinase/response regulator [Alteromonas sp.]|nr:hybrid sensor histidine kinase/response regulator [Alteromonas sp.]